MRRRRGTVKQPFEREGDHLYDRAEHGRIAIFDAPLFRRSHPKQRPTLAGLDLDALFARVDTDNSVAAYTIVTRRSEPDVAEALVAYARRTTVPTSAACHLLGQLGGAENRTALQRALAVLLESPMTFEKSESCNWAAQRAVAIATAILKLDRDAVGAADALVRLFRHPTPYNRMWAVWQAAAVAAEAPSLRTLAVECLREGLRPTVRDEDPRVFIKAIPALVSFGEAEWRETRKRCRKLLRDRDAWLRQDTVHLMLRCEVPDFTLLAEWFRNEPLARLRIEFASHFADLLPPSTIESLCREGLADKSPSLRYHALTLASYLDERRQRAVLTKALADEPDAELRTEMKRTAKQLGRG